MNPYSHNIIYKKYSNVSGTIVECSIKTTKDAVGLHLKKLSENKDVVQSSIRTVELSTKFGN